MITEYLKLLEVKEQFQNDFIKTLVTRNEELTNILQQLVDVIEYGDPQYIYNITNKAKDLLK